MQCAVILVTLDLGKIESSGNFSNLRKFAVFSRKTSRRRRKSVGNCPLVYLESGSLFVFWENDCCVLFVFNFRDSFPLEWPLIFTIDVESSPLLLYCFEEKSVPLDVLNKLHLIRTIFGSRILGQVSIHQSFLVLLLSKNLGIYFPALFHFRPLDDYNNKRFSSCFSTFLWIRF